MMKRSIVTNSIMRTILTCLCLMVGMLSYLQADSSEPVIKKALGGDVTSPPAEKVDVFVNGYLVDIDTIKGPDQLFHGDVVIVAHWSDPRLADASKDELRIMPLGEVWHPRLTIANMRKVKIYLPKVVEVKRDGTVTYRQRMVGDFTSRLDLHDFPNDKQDLGVQIVAQGYSPDQVHFVWSDEKLGQAESLTIADWTIGKVKMSDDVYSVSGVKQLAGVRFHFEATRHVAYYFATIFASAAIIVCMAWMVFWLPPEAINPRISISVTSMLTLVAHRFVVGRELPRLSYLTQMDMFLLGSTFMILIGLVGVVTIARVTMRGNPELGIKLNQIFRWVYPVLFICLYSVFI